VLCSGAYLLPMAGATTAHITPPPSTIAVHPLPCGPLRNLRLLLLLFPLITEFSKKTSQPAPSPRVMPCAMMPTHSLAATHLSCVLRWLSLSPPVTGLPTLAPALPQAAFLTRA
jgi:hypothetical protein